VEQLVKIKRRDEATISLNKQRNFMTIRIQRCRRRVNTFDNSNEQGSFLATGLIIKVKIE